MLDHIISCGVPICAKIWHKTVCDGIRLLKWSYMEQRQVRFIPLVDKRVIKWQVKLCDPLLICAIPEHLRNECYTNKAFLILKHPKLGITTASHLFYNSSQTQPALSLVSHNYVSAQLFINMPQNTPLTELCATKYPHQQL